MKKLKTIISSIIIAIFIISVTNAESFDPEVISQLSKNIAESKLMNEYKSEANNEKVVYVSSSLENKRVQGGGEYIEVIDGINALNSIPAERTYQVQKSWVQIEYKDVYSGYAYCPS